MLLQPAQVFAAVDGDDRAAGGHPLVVDAEQFVVRRTAAQERVLLRQQAAVLAQRRHIARERLADGHIEDLA